MTIDRAVVATAISWLGLWVHEIHRVRGLLGLTPDGDLFMLPIAAALALWWMRTRSASPALGLVAYSAVNLIGGWLTVMPLGWLPFAPEQTMAHYAVHVVYAVSQLPLLTLAGTRVWNLGRVKSATRD